MTSQPVNTNATAVSMRKITRADPVMIFMSPLLLTLGGHDHLAATNTGCREGGKEADSGPAGAHDRGPCWLGPAASSEEAGGSLSLAS